MPCNTPPPPSLNEMEEAIENAPDQLIQDYDDEDIIELEDMEEADDSELTFGPHSNSVLCCNFNKSGNLAVSGGQDDHAFVWNTTSGEIKFECTGHTDSVIAAEFNHDSTLVATAGMDGIIQAWNVDSGIKVWNYETSEITWMTWHPSSNILFAGTSDGNCWKWTIPGETCELFPTNGSSSGCGQLFSNGSRCAIGYMDGSIKVWDTSTQSVLASATGKEAHSSNVISLACSPDGNLIVTGSEDGTAKLIKSSNCKVLHTWECSPSGDEDKETVESVGFIKSHPLVVVGTNGGNLRIFDVSSYTQRATVNVNDPIVKIICSSTSPMVYVAAGESIELFDGRTAQLQKSWEGHELQILDVALSEQGDKLLTASDDLSCKIFKT